ncbi:gamma-type small acid-soluble spore protein [Lysinibacillus yapensis]|uniref:Gamma-type small acid-soluble spore protein n=2 Tax=Ureibacillus yapensis TaxID=2304605 RepID=A0A396S527_9BACL|nr:gamma-type small acid-soluble spore protein [Lysinibacillus yapensis]
MGGSFGAGKTSSGTDIQQVREEIAQESAPFSVQNQQQGSAGKTMAGTDVAAVRRQNQQAEQGKRQF